MINQRVRFADLQLTLCFGYCIHETQSVLLLAKFSNAALLLLFFFFPTRGGPIAEIDAGRESGGGGLRAIT